MDDQARELELMEHRLKASLRQALEERVGELKEQVFEDRRDHNRRMSDEVQALKQRIDELDAVLRGKRGDNGLSSDIRTLKESESSRVWRERAMLMLIVGLVINAVWDKVLGV